MTEDNVETLDFGAAGSAPSAVDIPPLVRFGYLAALAACGLVPLGGGLLFWAWRGGRGAKRAG